MSWWLALGFAGYTGLILRQGFMIFRTAGKAGLWFAPYLLLKLMIMSVAITYWVPEYCNKLILLGTAGFTFAAIFSVVDASRTLKFVFVDAAHPVAEVDDLNIALALFTTVFCPAVVLYFLAKILLFKQCVAI